MLYDERIRRLLQVFVILFDICFAKSGKLRKFVLTFDVHIVD